MQNDTSEKKDSILKILAITGFIGIIVFIAWASIQLVSVAPSAFSSLASLAEGVNSYSKTTVEDREVDTLTVTSNTLLANSGDTVTVNWGTARANGSYVFSYECAEGVAIDLVNVTGLQSIQCETNYNLGNTDTVSLVIDSEKNRYSDVAYSISYLGTNDTRPRAVGSAALTVMNSDVSSSLATNQDTTEETIPESPTTPPTTPSTPTTPTTPSTPQEPVYTQEYIYAIPTSDPNGQTDLAARYLFVGKIENNRFEPAAIRKDETGAIQFEVKNFGTKTSKKWSFTVSLPGGGEYESSDQAPLKPNERAVLTIGFSGADQNAHTFDVAVFESTDRNTANNDFSHRVTFFD